MGNLQQLEQVGWREAAKVLASMQGIEFLKVDLPIVAAATAQDTSLVLPKGTVVMPFPLIEVMTAEATGATKTVDIGISGGDEDGFLNGASVAAVATVKGTLLNTGQTLGVLLAVDENGSGVLVPEPYICSAATTICYTLGSDDFEELSARLWLPVVQLTA